MYDHNQTLVPDSFMALHSANGRPLLSRHDTEARFEICEDLALHTAAFLASRHQEGDDGDEALRRCRAGLAAEPVVVAAAFFSVVAAMRVSTSLAPRNSAARR